MCLTLSNTSGFASVEKTASTKAWRAGRFDAVVVVKKDRLYRGIIHNAPKWPFKVISLTEREIPYEKKNQNRFMR